MFEGRKSPFEGGSRGMLSKRFGLSKDYFLNSSTPRPGANCGRNFALSWRKVIECGTAALGGRPPANMTAGAAVPHSVFR